MFRDYHFFFFKKNKEKVILLIKASTVVVLIITIWITKVFLDFYCTKRDYKVVKANLENQRTPFTEKELQELTIAQTDNLYSIDYLSDYLKKHRIILPLERIVVNSNQFQMQLQKDLDYLKEKSEEKSIIFSNSFFLGLIEEKVAIRNSEDAIKKSKEEFLLFWIADHLFEYNSLTIS